MLTPGTCKYCKKPIADDVNGFCPSPEDTCWKAFCAREHWKENLEGRRLLGLAERGDLEALKRLSTWVAGNKGRCNPLDADGAETMAICVGYGFHCHFLDEKDRA